MKKSLLFTYAAIAAFGAFVVGLNLGGISGALGFIVEEFRLSAMMTGSVTASIMIGCLFGALVGGRCGDRYGRRGMMIVSALVLTLSAAGCAAADGALWLIAARLVGGFGIGILSAVIPVYISEISPAAWRGTLVSFYQLFVVVGILVAYFADYSFAGREYGWRLMLGLPMLFAVVNALSLILLPESPRWLMQNGRTADAVRAIARIGISESDADAILAAGRKPDEPSARVSDLFRGTTAKIVLLGSMLAFFQQITGINVVINYAPGILSGLGIAGGNPLLQTVAVGAANLLFTLVALWTVDKFDRKTLLVGGCIGCAVSLAYLTYAFSTPSPNNAAVLAAILAYIGFFALSLSPLMFVVTAEIYPSNIRGTAMALSTGISWFCSFLVVQLYPLVESSLGANAAFGGFAVLCVAAAGFIALRIPETRGRSLEEIERYFSEKYNK